MPDSGVERWVQTFSETKQSISQQGATSNNKTESNGAPTRNYEMVHASVGYFKLEQPPGRAARKRFQVREKKGPKS